MIATTITTDHPQVVAANGVDVDEGIRDLLEVLWIRGLETEFSCQGGHGKLAHICFSRVADADRFVEGPGEFLVTVGETRAWVDFPAHLIGPLTRYWSQQEVDR